jgi:hypothetical protein
LTKKHILLLSACLYNIQSEYEQKINIFIQSAFKYCIELCLLDADYVLRDYAKLISKLINSKPDKGLNSILIHASPVYKYEITKTKFNIGSLSHYLEQEVEGYQPLPDWQQNTITINRNAVLLKFT